MRRTPHASSRWSRKSATVSAMAPSVRGARNVLDKHISPRRGAGVPRGHRLAHAVAPDARRTRMLAVLRQFRVIVGALRRHYAIVEERSGVGGAQLWALGEIAAAAELKVGELARGMGIHAST